MAGEKALEGKAIAVTGAGRDGFDGPVPCQVDGGVKCFDHAIGASDLRMIDDMDLQKQGCAGERQRRELPHIGLTCNRGGFPDQNVRAISIVGRTA